MDDVVCLARVGELLNEDGQKVVFTSFEVRKSFGWSESFGVEKGMITNLLTLVTCPQKSET